MKISYVMLPDYPIDETIESIKLADRLGYYAAYAADETWHKDLWLLFAAAADKTQNIRFGPNLSPVTLREPTLICQAAATLDELTGGRAECVISSGNFGLLAQYGIDWAKTKPLSRVKEAHHVMRTFLDDGAITFEGEFYNYTGLFSFARPVQERLPLKLGAMRGPKSFQAAGEISDGVHHALSYTREAYDYLVDNVKIGAERAGRDWQSLDIGAWVVFATGEDGEAAKQAARAMVGLYASSMPAEQLRRNDVDPDSLQEIIAAVGAGDLPRAYELTSPELAEKLSVAGTPEECAEKINREILASGVNHMILAITDSALVKAFSGMEMPGVLSMAEQLQLVHDKVKPALSA
ncbi:5,10-methylene tetrahydromethanopterin reductase [Streptomyces abyssalis]|uniref:5,10-methylene tetrahydromethanopterin reductase n=1 Tax=Streptomyces abyssalis TaxID=933944 RepID=A0A1E7JN64_9ACTN|nr:LLM class flavin-dependent oxidoreductase [Streptomyces abyssalis]OEU86894.1 5,10-methylene tetrahydromethanopterin reductase [Streptomyces abyssalis]OEU89722.1 5,10-methylene tetrahydromethanopterin reductase [Streptomyces abyssalis]OEV31332.1 5,10-methylene tetrahydromethanopterin reductase [Streptomyces nanshensis]